MNVFVVKVESRNDGKYADDFEGEERILAVTKSMKTVKQIAAGFDPRKPGLKATLPEAMNDVKLIDIPPLRDNGLRSIKFDQDDDRVDPYIYQYFDIYFEEFELIE